MKLSALIIIAVFATVMSPLSYSDTAFKIPQSTVVELEEFAEGRIYPIYIKLPPSYASDPFRNYPVIYLTDAMYGFQVAAGATYFPMNSGAMAEAIIVGIAYSKGDSGATSRIRDYTPTEAAGWKRLTGEADRHIKFIQGVVIPYIESNYRTDSNARTFVGNSLGGLFGIHILMTQPDLFTSYIIGSPSVWFEDNYILSVPSKKPTRAVRVYLSVGSLETPQHGEKQDLVAGVNALVQKFAEIEDSRILVKLSIIEDARHATAFPTTITHGLDWLYGKN